MTYFFRYGTRFLARFSGRTRPSISPGFHPLEIYRNVTLNRFMSAKSADLLTDEERKAYSRLFKEMDKDNDGIISKDELKKGLQDFIGYEATDSELNESMVVLDKDKDGKVDMKDFLEHMQTRKKETRLEAISAKRLKAIKSSFYAK